jgi:threonylcarbamoyladenosine tRNA methylthiotransferase MtaB
MPQVASTAIKERAARLREKGRAALAAYLDAQIGHDAELLIERRGLGRTPGFAEVETDPDIGEPGDVVNVRVTGSNGSRLRGAPPAPKCAL